MLEAYIASSCSQYLDATTGVVSDMLVCLQTVGQVDSSVLRLLPSLIPSALKIIEKYWAKDVLRNQALLLLSTMLQHHQSVMQRDLLLDLSGVSVVSRRVLVAC